MLLTSSSRLAEKRRPIIAMSAAALRQKCFERQEWPPEECGENKYGATVHFPFRRPGALI
jgi:hypothetical protein